MHILQKKVPNIHLLKKPLVFKHPIHFFRKSSALLEKFIFTEILCFLWNPDSLPPVVPILSQLNPVNTFSHYFPKIHSNIILLYAPTPSIWFIPFRFPKQNSGHISYLKHTCCMSPPFHPP